MLEQLQALGLGRYEARALEHLLTHGTATAPELSRDSGIPFGRIYDTLNGLAARNLVSDDAGRPKRYQAAAPSAIPGRLTAYQRRRMQEREKELETTAASLQDAMQELPPNPSPAVHGLRIGEQEGRAFLVEKTHEARERVDAMLPFRRIKENDLALFDAFRDAVARGVTTRLLLREQDVEYLLSTPYVGRVLEAMRPHLGETLQVRLTNENTMACSILDGENVVIGVRNPADPDAYFAVINLEDAEYAADVSKRFDTLWREAKLDLSMVQGLLSRWGIEA